MSMSNAGERLVLISLNTSLSKHFITTGVRATQAVRIICNRDSSPRDRLKMFVKTAAVDTHRPLAPCHVLHPVQ